MYDDTVQPTEAYRYKDPEVPTDERVDTRRRSLSPRDGYRRTMSPHGPGAREYVRGQSPPRYSRAPRRPVNAPIAPQPSNVLGVFGLSIKTQERDLEDEFSRFGRVEKVTIVYDQRSERSRGFGFVKMSTVEDASRCINELNGANLNGRVIRVDYSITDRPHNPTPGQYMGHRRARDDPREPSYGSYGRDRPRDYRDRDRERYEPRERHRDWRDRRSPIHHPSRYSPDHRRRRSYSSLSPPRTYDAPSGQHVSDSARW